MPTPPTSKLKLTDTTVLESKQNTRAFLIANGWDDNQATTDVAAGCAHLSWIYGPPKHVQIDIEKTPAHYQIIVTPL